MPGTSSTTFATQSAEPVASAATATVSWPLWCSVAAVTSVVIGLHWDVSWHRSIGRDTFFTPAHVAIYLCGILAGLSCGYLILSTTFGRSPAAAGARAASIGVWGFRGPLGAFIAAWGGITMLASAPFDDWWHSAYGLDVKILSPPHAGLAIGIFAVQTGALILVLGQMNRASGAAQRLLRGLFLYVGGVMLTSLLMFTLEYAGAELMHSAVFYRVIALATVTVLVAGARASGARYGATTMAAVYTVLLCGFEWILPLFPAEPKLGPVFQKVTHFIPNGFPILLIAPALAIDLLLERAAAWPRWLLALACGTGFLVLLVAVQWPFGSFLMSPGSRNWVFGTHYLSYFDRPEWSHVQHLFLRWERTPGAFAAGLAVALGCAIVMSGLGLLCGDRMRRIRR